MMCAILRRCVLLLSMAVTAAGCGATARLAVSDGTGPKPVLPEPDRSIFPTVHVVTAKGWSGDERPMAAPGLNVAAFDGDGVAETRSILLQNLNSPFGMALIGNRKPRSGYKVIFVQFYGGRPSGHPIDVLRGFVRENGDAMGRPVGVAIDRGGALLVADDVGNVVGRVVGDQR